MHCFDFLSEPPKIFIFQKRRNQTNFGGILFLIYIIIMVLISLAYIIDYSINDKYTYEALTFYNHTDDAQEISSMNKDLELNPFLNLTLFFYQPDDKFAVYDLHNQEFMNTSSRDAYGNIIYNIRKQISDINITIYYKCEEDRNCSSLNEFIELYGYSIFTGVDINYTNYKINHGEDIPVQKSENKPETFFDAYITEKLGLEIWNFEWEVIKYKDQRSLFDSLTKNRKEYNFGHIKNKKPEKEYNDINYVKNFKEKGYYFPLFEIHFINKHDEYILYKRKKVELLNVLANIGALFSTIKFFFSMSFSFYSKNFDNYKLIEKILNYSKNKKNVNVLNIDSNISTESKQKEDNIDIMNNINNLDPLIDEKLNDNNLDKKDPSINKVDNEENKVEDKKSVFV